MSNQFELRKKYPRWAHRRDAHKKRRRKSRRKRKRARKQLSQGSTTEGMLLSLLQQLMVGGTRLPAKKHGENVVTGHAGGVAPDALAPVRSRMQARLMREGGTGGTGAAGAAAVGAIGPAGPAGYAGPARRT